MNQMITKKVSNNYIGGKIVNLLRRYLKCKYLFLMLLPALIYYAIFRYAPIYGVILAFKDFKINLGILNSPWVGLENFKDLFSTPSFYEVFRNTLLISVYKLIAGFPAPIILAILLNELKHDRFKKTIQTISYLPYFLSWVILAGIFYQFFSPSSGPINIILKEIGIKPIYFMADSNWFRSILVSTSVWKEIGWSSIIYIAALAGINYELYEAAHMDGATRVQTIFHITLPSLVPVVTIMFIFAVGKLITDDFDQIFNLYNSAVYSVGDVLSTYTYRYGIVDMQYSFATAVGLFRNVIAFTLIVITNTISKRVNEYGLW